MIKRQNIAALYLRLSRDDGGDAESNSIQTQRMMLQKYAKDHGFVVFDEYVDDGISGTTFQRPNFQRMIADIEAEKVTIVVCKDLSRLGRNNAMIAFYTEIFFPDRDIRLIAIGDGIDTAHGDNEILPFKSVINEYYARDISKKIRSARKARAHNGEYSAYVAPIGYRKDPKDKHRLIVDEEGAKIVRHIFNLAVQGYGLTKIARTLTEEGIPTIRQFSEQHYEDYPEGMKAKTNMWSMASVRVVLQNKTYLGYVVNGKTTTKSFKNSKLVKKPKDQWIEIPNMHEPLISEDTFNLAQKLIHVKRRETKEKHENIFAGLVKCATCNTNLSLMHSRREGTVYESLICNKYRSYSAVGENRLCTAHYTPVSLVNDSVLAYIRVFAAKAKEHEHDLETYARRFAGKNDDKALQHSQTEINRINKRIRELDTIVERLFEEYALGNIGAERFQSMSGKYEQEHSNLKERLDALNKKVDEQKDAVGDTMRFLQEILPYTEAETLNREMLLTLVDRIVAHEGSGWRHRRTQKLEIYFRFVGAIDPELFFS
jgi:DNA invertase Pin-like site-specific DNA recombinase/tetrahydromethanopterin S-methyltransferase subunit G